MKGKRLPTKAYELVATKLAKTRLEAARIERHSKIVGRAAELRAIESAYEKSRSGQGQIVGIVGEAGIGKSRILYEFKRSLPKGDCMYLEGDCRSYGQNTVYLPILEALRSYFEIEEGERGQMIKKKVREKVRQLDENLEEILPSIYQLLYQGREEETSLEPQPWGQKEKIFEAPRDLLVRESQNHPLVLAVDDLQWIDRTSEEFISYLVAWLLHARILIVCLYRPDYHTKWGGKSYYSQINVSQLSKDSSVKMLKDILKGGNVAPNLRNFIMDKAGGNPSFLKN